MGPTARRCRAPVSARLTAGRELNARAVGGGCASRWWAWISAPSAKAGEDGHQRPGRGAASLSTCSRRTRSSSRSRATRTFAAFGQQGAGVQSELPPSAACPSSAYESVRRQRRTPPTDGPRDPDAGEDPADLRRRRCSVKPQVRYAEREPPLRRRATPQRDLLSRRACGRRVVRRRGASEAATAPKIAVGGVRNEMADAGATPGRHRDQGHRRRHRPRLRPGGARRLRAPSLPLTSRAGRNCRDLSPNTRRPRPADRRGLPDRGHRHVRARHAKLDDNDPERPVPLHRPRRGHQRPRHRAADSSIAGPDQRPIVTLNNNPDHGSRPRT